MHKGTMLAAARIYIAIISWIRNHFVHLLDVGPTTRVIKVQNVHSVCMFVFHSYHGISRLLLLLMVTILRICSNSIFV
jgi:hypothetical protein